MKIVNLKNNIIYNKVYNSKETMKDSHEYPNINLVRLQKWFLNKNGKVLDHGFGYCENSIHLANENYKVYGLEISKKLINYAIKKTSKKKLKKKPLIRI